MNMDFNKMIPELSVFDIEQTKRFYNDLGFKIEYELLKKNSFSCLFKIVNLCLNKFMTMVGI